MVTVSIDHSDLVVEIKGLDKLWAFKRRLRIPLANVRGATADPGITHGFKGIRVFGTHIPGWITAGNFHQGGEQVFWDVHNPAGAVVIELQDERYTRLVIEVHDPSASVALIEKALA